MIKINNKKGIALLKEISNISNKYEEVMFWVVCHKGMMLATTYIVKTKLCCVC